MRKFGAPHMGRPFSDRRWLLPFLASLLVSMTLLLGVVFGLFSSPDVGVSETFEFTPRARIKDPMDYFAESDFKNLFDPSKNATLEAPRIAYLITGTKGDSQRMRRTLQALYHPRNQYILHLDFEAPPRERIELAMYVKGDPTFSEVRNVHVIAKANLVTYKGPTMIACTLHAVAVLLKESAKWDWFINLSASDYPLVTQDALLFLISPCEWSINRNQRARPIIVDPGLYLSKKYDIVTTSQRRALPTAFKLFTGYFHTVICNSERFRNSTISHDLHYIAWDSPPKQHPLSLSTKDFKKMVNSSAPFARKFEKEDPVLDKIDSELLGRSEGQFTPGAWCIGRSDGGADPCSLRGEDDVFRPGPGSDRLRELFQKLLSPDYRNNSCPS
ncbi:hypothetical protein QJS10_CPA09g01421 [Acorus calamus]|uniref:Uncharacterized protein n=1 Tax=Acorus calamus TaxID=4465 RepID=A0AAV9EC78_ACOCL|nr:hypothetical protein QJS10_CPA09g01421 [Acorus calamus]